MREKSGILWILGISESIFDLWKFFVSILGNKDLILGLWWLILSLWESSSCSGSWFSAHGITCRPLCVYFGFQRSSFTICEPNLGLLVYFRLLAVDYRPLSIYFWPMEIDIGLNQLIFLYRKSQNWALLWISECQF